MPLRHWETRLNTEHSRTGPSRFSEADRKNPGNRIAYFGQTHQVVLHEVSALFGKSSDPLPNPKGSWLILCLDLVLDNVVDLSHPDNQELLKTNHQELTGNWDNPMNEVPTQLLGRELYQLTDLEGFIYPSSRVDGVCLAIFPDKLGPRSSISFFNEITKKTEIMI